MLEELKKEVYEANMQLPKYGLVTFTWGNVSGIDREKGLFVIKPSGVEYDKLTPEDMVVVDLEGNKVEGKYNPSSDTATHVREKGLFVIKPSGVEYDKLTPEDMVVVDLEGNKVEGKYNPSSDTATHVILYNRFPNIGGIVHTHSSWATSWAQAGRGIPCYGTTHADYIYGEVPCVRNLTKKEIDGIVHTHSSWATSWAQAGRGIPCYGTTHADYIYGEVPCVRNLTKKEIDEAYEKNTGVLIADEFERMNLDYEAVPAVLCKNHGPFTWGKDAHEAVHNAVVLEEVAKMAARCEQINPQNKPAPQELQDKHYYRKHGANAYYGQK